MQKSIPFAGILCLLAALPSCKKEEAAAPEARPYLDPEQETNQMKNGLQGLLSSRKNSLVNWQHWDPAVLKMAADSRRLIFVLALSAHHPGCLETLDFIDATPNLARRLNENFVPVLADVEVARELGLAAFALTTSSQNQFTYPFLLVISPEGHEVSWHPVLFSRDPDFGRFFENATDVIIRLWRDSPDYVFANSRRDNELRVANFAPPDRVVEAGERDFFLTEAARQLSSQFDAEVGEMDGAGGLLPLGILQCLALASTDPAIPEEIAKRSGNAARDFSDLILKSAMIDPLDGGVYSGKFRRSWNFAVPQRTCTQQARAARTLTSLYSVTGDRRELNAALGAISFAESEYLAADGLFSNQRQPVPTSPAEWLWSVGQIDAALSSQEAALWKAVARISNLGNISAEDDPVKNFFRLNSLCLGVPLDQAAATAGVSPADAPALLESGRKKLLEARLGVLPRPAPADRGRAAPTFRMVSAYAALFTATGAPEWRDKALDLGKRSREAFTNGNLLIEEGPPVPAAAADARAFTYALTIQAALDLAEISMDDSWRLWAGDLTTVLSEQFIHSDGRLMEARSESTPLKLPLEDRVMLYDDSTYGIMRLNAARLSALGHALPPEIAPLVRSLPMVAELPVICTDSIAAISFERSRVIVEIPANASAAWREAAARLPLDRIARRIVTADAVSVILPDGSRVTPGSPEELATAVAWNRH